MSVTTVPLVGATDSSTAFLRGKSPLSLPSTTTSFWSPAGVLRTGSPAPGSLTHTGLRSELNVGCAVGSINVVST